jgi:hypothetical protein
MGDLQCLKSRSKIVLLIDVDNTLLNNGRAVELRCLMWDDYGTTTKPRDCVYALAAC